MLTRTQIVRIIESGRLIAEIPGAATPQIGQTMSLKISGMPVQFTVLNVNTVYGEDDGEDDIVDCTVIS